MSSSSYLFALFNGESCENAATVFYHAATEPLAKLICRLFEMASTEKGIKFTAKPPAAIPLEEQVLLDEALDWLEVYNEPDRHVYDPPPSREMHQRAQYAQRAKDWADRLQRKSDASTKPNTSPNAQTIGLSPEDNRDAALHLLLVLAQAYYGILENTIGCPCRAVDLELNQSYLWTVSNITNLFKNSGELGDFPGGEFAPLFPDVYPATLQDIDWEDVAPDAQAFLSAVQSYVFQKGPRSLTEGSPAWIFVELFRPSVTTAIEKAGIYHERMHKHMQRVLRQAAPAGNGNGESAPAPMQTQQHPNTELGLNRHTRPVHFEDFSGHEFERLVLAYAMRAEWPEAEWLGAAGSDGGRDIWGEDKEGKSTVLMCANFKNLTFTKASSDLNKLARGKTKPDQVIVVAGGQVSAQLREKIKSLSVELGFVSCRVWSGPELEERIRRTAEHLLERFCRGVSFPETRSGLKKLNETSLP